MWTFILSLLKKHWLRLLFILVPLGVVAILVWKWNNMKETIIEQKQIIFQQQQTIKILESNIDKLTSSIQKVNQSLQTVSKTSEEVKQQFTNLTNNVNKQVGSLSVRLENVFKQPKPPTCEKAIEYLIDAKQEYKNTQEHNNVKNNNSSSSEEHHKINFVSIDMEDAEQHNTEEDIEKQPKIDFINIDTEKDTKEKSTNGENFKY